MPLDEHIEGGHGEREPRLKIRPHPVHDFLEVADERQHGKYCLHQHALLPLPPLTQFEVTRIALRGMEAGVTQDAMPLKSPCACRLQRRPSLTQVIALSLSLSQGSAL